MAEKSTDQLYALVDMGSNGIRFSITDLSPPTTRCLPTIYQSRLGISLYDVQYQNGQKGPIPADTIAIIISALKRFKQTSLDFGVPQKPDNVRILATEATRTAVNSSEYIREIQRTLGEPWKVDILGKEDEGRIGALGVVSSVGGSEGVEGLMMDLGGGSTQLTWLICHPTWSKPMQSSPRGSISFPYGAAAMTRLLAEKTTEKARLDLRKTMIQEFRAAYNDLELPPDLQQKAHTHGLTLYLSGGGFRGWGYLLMSSHRIRPYPIPILNGFSVPVKDFKNTSLVGDLAQQSLQDGNVFRVSKRRAAQVPAVSFLIDALATAIPTISEARFCQGGVREGWLFDTLPISVRAADPLVAASGKYCSSHDSAAKIADLLAASIPPNSSDLDRRAPKQVKDSHLLKSFANTLFLQQSHSKETAALNALHVPITGVLANAHGAGHIERALLALMLCQRWGGESDLPAPHGELKARLEMLLSQQQVWWARYIGIIGNALGEVYPAGIIKQERISIEAVWTDGLGKKGLCQGVVVTLRVKKAPDGDAAVSREVVSEIVETIEAMGKKKSRVGGREYGFGVPLRVDVEYDA